MTTSLRTTLLAAAIVAISAVTMSSAETISVPAVTTVASGTVANIVISGSFESGGTARLTLSYPANILRIRGIRGASAWGMRCENPIIIGDDVSSTTGTITFECSDVGSGIHDTVAVLECDILVGGSLEGLLVPTALRRNGADVTNAVFGSGLVRRDGQPVGIVPPSDVITSVYPNPMRETARIVFTMETSGTARFAILNAQGRLVRELPAVVAVRGENDIALEVEPWELASGSYILQLRTESSASLYSFVVMR